jgi:hypothetical protein
VSSDNSFFKDEDGGQERDRLELKVCEEYQEKFYELGDKYKRDDDLGFQNDISTSNIYINSLVISFKDGEIYNYIGLGAHPAQKLIEVILSNLSYSDKTQTFKGGIRNSLHALPNEEYFTH